MADKHEALRKDYEMLIEKTKSEKAPLSWALRL